MRLSDKGLLFIANFEGFEPVPKNNGVDRFLTIGYGHLVTAADKKTNRFKTPLTRETGLSLLRSDIAAREKSVNDFITKYKLAPKQNEFDALVSFTYNVGTGWLLGCQLKTLLIKKSKEPELYRVAFGNWCKSGIKVIPGLVRRLREEAEMFIKGDYKI